MKLNFKQYTIFKDKRSMEMYTRIHLEQKFVCSCCLKTFSSQSKLKRHQLLHTGMNYFGFNHNNGIELSEVLTLKNVRKLVYSVDKKFICFFAANLFVQVVTKTII